MKNINDNSIIEILLSEKDENYKNFHKKLIPNINEDIIIGVRTPILRKTAKELFGTKTAEKFLNALPHKYYEENNLHGFLIEQIKDFDECIACIEKFLPYIDNWATCDMLKPKVFKKSTKRLLPYIKKWLKSESVYTRRYAIVMLMTYYLDDEFSEDMLLLIKNAVCDEYYINMAVAWYFSLALVKQYDATIPIFENHEIKNKFVHNKSLQKARESFRIEPDKKEYFKTLKL